MTLTQHLTATSPAVPVDAVLQMLEQQRLSGVLQVATPEGGFGAYVRLREGLVVKALSRSPQGRSDEPLDAVLGMMRASELRLSWRTVRGVPTGTGTASPTGLLMAAASQLDEALANEAGLRAA